MKIEHPFESLLMAPKYKIKEAAKMCRISESQVRSLISSGTLPTIRIGGAIRILEGDLEEYLERSYGITKSTESSKYWNVSTKALPQHVIESEHLKTA